MKQKTNSVRNFKMHTYFYMDYIITSIYYLLLFHYYIIRLHYYAHILWNKVIMYMVYQILLLSSLPIKEYTACINYKHEVVMCYITGTLHQSTAKGQ